MRGLVRLGVDELCPGAPANSEPVAEAVPLDVLGTAGTRARHGEVRAVDPGDGSGAVATAAELLTRFDRDDVAGRERGQLLDGQPVLGGQGFLPQTVGAGHGPDEAAELFNQTVPGPLVAYCRSGDELGNSLRRQPPMRHAGAGTPP